MGRKRMRYYLGFVVFGLLMGALCVALGVHAPPPAPAMFGFFSAAAAAVESGGPDARPVPA